MITYNFPIYIKSKDTQKVYQPIVLDYIVSIGPVITYSFKQTGMGGDYCSFTIYTVGHPVEIKYILESRSDDIENLKTALIAERSKVIEAWLGKIF